MSPLFEKAFGKEAAEDFKAFSEAPIKPTPAGETPEEQIKTAGKISETDLENGFAAYNWRPKDLEPEDYIFQYTGYGRDIIEDKGLGLTFREFVFFEIDFISKRVEDEECTHCFNEIRKKIREFFDYADCADKGFITSEMLFKAVIQIT